MHEANTYYVLITNVRGCGVDAMSEQDFLKFSFPNLFVKCSKSAQVSHSFVNKNIPALKPQSSEKLTAGPRARSFLWPYIRA